MASKARRVVRELFQLFLAEPECLPCRMGRTARRERGRAGADRRRLPRRDDRPVCSRRASSVVRYLRAGIKPRHDPPGVNNIFGDFRRLVIAALDDLAARGALPSGLDFARVAVEPPRDPAHGDLATNAAMVLAGAAKQNPMALAEMIAASLSGRELESAGYRGSGFTVAATRPGFLNVRLDPAVWHAQLRAILRAGTAYGDTDLGGGERGQCRVRLGQSDRADACRAWPRRRGRRRARRAAGEGRVRRASRVLHQRCRRAGRCAGALDLSALPRGARRRRSGRSRRGFIPANISSRRAGAGRTRRRQMARPPGGRMARAGTRLRGGRDAAADPLRPRLARGCVRHLHLGARAGRERRGRQRRWTRCPSAG